MRGSSAMKKVQSRSASKSGEKLLDMRHLLQDSDAEVHTFVAEDGEPLTAAELPKLNDDLGGVHCINETLFVENLADTQLDSKDAPESKEQSSIMLHLGDRRGSNLL